MHVPEASGKLDGLLNVDSNINPEEEEEEEEGGIEGERGRLGFVK